MASTAVDAQPLIDDDLLQQINTWCGVHGLMYSDGGIKWNAAPLSLTPLPYPTGAFAFVRQMQPVWNYLMDSIARNRSFLLSELKNVAASDEEFTGTLYKLFRALPESQVRGAWALGVFRSDYMLSPSSSAEPLGFVPMQVEINTIASGLGCLSTKAGHFLRDFLLRHAAHPQVQRIFEEQEEFPSSSKPANTTKLIQRVAHGLEVSPSLRKIASAMAQAHEVYVRRLRSRAGNDDGGGDDADADALRDRIRVLFVVQPRERNVGDQRALEEELWRRHGVRCEFATFAELSRWLQVDRDSGGNDAPTLFLQRGPDRARYEVSLVYFRAGYTPSDYVADESHGECAAALAGLAEASHDADLHQLLCGNAAWRVRWTIERSRAIKCPSLGLHLAGTKAVQAAVAREGVLEALLTEASRDDAWAARAAALLRRCFAEQHLLSATLEAPSVAARGGPSAAIDAALACDGRDWVLKPQREGGGNNLYREALADALRAARGSSSAQLQGKRRAASRLRL
jgi:glutathione synthase